MTCSTCKRPTTDPKRGQCQRCYLAEYNGRTKDRSCASCGFSDARALVRRKMEGAWQTLCGNCAAILGRRRITVPELCAELRAIGDRRAADRRRGDRRAARDRRELVDIEALETCRREGGRRATDAERRGGEP